MLKVYKATAILTREVSVTFFDDEKLDLTDQAQEALEFEYGVAGAELSNIEITLPKQNYRDLK